MGLPTYILLRFLIPFFFLECNISRNHLASLFSAPILNVLVDLLIDVFDIGRFAALAPFVLPFILRNH
jgi:hypothetical protein